MRIVVSSLIAGLLMTAGAVNAAEGGPAGAGVEPLVPFMGNFKGEWKTGDRSGALTAKVVPMGGDK
ncbi:MAG: hypothetical protein ACRC1K_02490, partial [Planctomycetia bacterium]